MASSDELAAFVASSFHSVWALELLLLLKREGRSFSHEELVSSLRASPAVVEKAINSLIAAGLASGDDESMIYMPVSPETALLVEETEELYRSRPNRVRRLIVASANKGLGPGNCLR